MTNYDRIKNMSFDEFVLFLHTIYHIGFGFVEVENKTFTNENLKDWLKKEV